MVFLKLNYVRLRLQCPWFGHLYLFLSHGAQSLRLKLQIQQTSTTKSWSRWEWISSFIILACLQCVRGIYTHTPKDVMLVCFGGVLTLRLIIHCTDIMCWAVLNLVQTYKDKWSFLKTHNNKKNSLKLNRNDRAPL